MKVLKSEKKIIDKAYESADSCSYSAVFLENEEFFPVGKHEHHRGDLEIFRDGLNRQWFDISSKRCLYTQRKVVMALKGIVPVADIVDDKSLEINLLNTPLKTWEELGTDMLLVDLVFQDGDRWAHDNIEPGGHKNMTVQELSKDSIKYYFYDFGSAESITGFGFEPETIQSLIENAIGEGSVNLVLLKQKLESLFSQFSGDSGKNLFAAIHKKAGGPDYNEDKIKFIKEQQGLDPAVEIDRNITFYYRKFIENLTMILECVKEFE